MSDLESQIARLRLAKRRWKVLALTACGALALFIAAQYARVVVERARAERAQAEAQQALADAVRLRQSSR